MEITSKVHCFHGCNIQATNISSIKTYIFVSSCGCSTLSDMNSLIPEKILSVGFSERRVCIHSNCISMSWNTVAMVSSIEIVSSDSKNKSLCCRFRMVELHRCICNHLLLFLMIIIIENNAKCVKRTNNNTMTELWVDKILLKSRSSYKNS